MPILYKRICDINTLYLPFKLYFRQISYKVVLNDKKFQKSEL